MSSPSPPTPESNHSAGDLSGRRLGDFHLLRRLGHGAMAEVYLAEQEHLKRRVALKILKPELADDRTYLRRFELEAQAAASLIHTNIVQIYEVGCIDQLHYIAQEYVQGRNLRDYLARHGPLDLSHALSIIRQVASALAKAAEQGVIHRDIKPENIMLTAGGEVKVADFGLARLTREGTANDLTQIGITLGTPLYMSPEQVEGKPLDPRSDIYSFGVTCYQMLVGKPPFTGETALGVAVQHLKSRPQPLETLRPDLPPALCRIVHRMLAKNPAERFDSARDLLRELHRVQVEHFGADWPEDLPGLEPLAAEMADDPRIAATRQLEEVMKSSALMRPAGVAGVGLRRGLWRRSSSAGPRPGGPSFRRRCWPGPRPPSRKSTGSAPSNARPFASQLGTEAAWQSVIDYFPEEDNLRPAGQTATLPDLSAERAVRSGDGDFRRTGRPGQRPARVEGLRSGREMRGVEPPRPIYGIGRRPQPAMAHSRPAGQPTNAKIAAIRHRAEPLEAGTTVGERMGPVAFRAVPRRRLTCPAPVGKKVDSLIGGEPRRRAEKKPPSSSGPGHRILSPKTGVRLP